MSNILILPDIFSKSHNLVTELPGRSTQGLFIRNANERTKLKFISIQHFFFETKIDSIYHTSRFFNCFKRFV